MHVESLPLLQLLQLADSQVPIGATAHSFGLETLADAGILTVEGLGAFLRGYYEETGAQEAAFCRAAYRLRGGPSQARIPAWIALNHRLSALKPARESRQASATLGRRFLQLVLGLEPSPLLREALDAAKRQNADTHHCTAFGLAGGTLRLKEDITVLAYLQQSLAGLVSACQRLLPLGQSQASAISWGLKPVLMEAAAASSVSDLEESAAFTPLVDLGGMRHPSLVTRLFIS